VQGSSPRAGAARSVSRRSGRTRCRMRSSPLGI